jgi:copper transport protein
VTALTRGLLRLAVLIAATVAALLALAAPALAHAVLESTNPAAGSVLKQSPRELSLDFGEGVIASGQAIHLYDDHLDAVPIGSIRHLAGDGNLIAASVPSPLRVGTYTVTWRVTSADTHVVSGAFTFSVGHPTTVRGTPPEDGESSTTRNLGAVARALGYAGLVAGPGVLVVLAWLWPAGLAQRRVRRLVVGGGAVLVVATVASVVVQGAAAAGVSVTHAINGSTLDLGMAGRFGRAAAARLVLLIAMAELVLLGRARGRLSAPLVTLVAIALAATWPYAGHSGTGDLAPLAFIADWVHVAAMTAWLGGLAMLLVGLLRDPAHDEPDSHPAAVTAVFSEWALNAVTLLVATGLFAAWRNVREIGALTATHYGRLLLWKTGVVVLILIVARVARRHAERPDRSGEAPLPGLRRAVTVEAFGAAVVLAITAFLTATPPASQTYAPAVTRSATDDGITVTVHVDRTSVGVTQLVVSATRDGRPQRITGIGGSLSEVDPPVGPLPVTFRAAGVGRQIATVTFPDPGSWSLMVSVRTSPINAIAVSTTIRVR